MCIRDRRDSASMPASSSCPSSSTSPDGSPSVYNGNASKISVQPSSCSRHSAGRRRTTLYATCSSGHTLVMASEHRRVLERPPRGLPFITISLPILTPPSARAEDVYKRKIYLKARLIARAVRHIKRGEDCANYARFKVHSASQVCIDLYIYRLAIMRLRRYYTLIKALLGYAGYALNACLLYTSCARSHRRGHQK